MMTRKSLIEMLGNCFKALPLACLLIVSSSTSAIEINGGSCDDAMTMPLNASTWIYGGSRTQFYKLEVPSAGLVTVDVAVPGPADEPAKVGLFNQGCGASGSSNFMVVEHTPTSLTLITDMADTYVFAVAAQDPRSSLGEYKFTVGYAAVHVEVPPSSTDEEIRRR